MSLPQRVKIENSYFVKIKKNSQKFKLTLGRIQQLFVSQALLGVSHSGKKFNNRTTYFLQLNFSFIPYSCGGVFSNFVKISTFLWCMFVCEGKKQEIPQKGGKRGKIWPFGEAGFVRLGRFFSFCLAFSRAPWSLSGCPSLPVEPAAVAEALDHPLAPTSHAQHNAKIFRKFQILTRVNIKILYNLLPVKKSIFLNSK